MYVEPHGIKFVCSVQQKSYGSIKLPSGYNNNLLCSYFHFIFAIKINFPIVFPLKLNKNMIRSLITSRRKYTFPKIHIHYGFDVIKIRKKYQNIKKNRYSLSCHFHKNREVKIESKSKEKKSGYGMEVSYSTTAFDLDIFDGVHVYEIYQKHRLKILYINHIFV